MKIAMIGSRGIPAKIGGVEKVVEDLSNQLVSRGHDVAVYSRDYYVKGNSTATEAQQIVTSGVAHKKLEAITYSFSAVRDAITRNDFDIIHIHSPGPAMWTKLAKKTNIPVVFTVHADDWNRKRWSFLARAILKLGLKTGMKYADAVTAVSSELASNLSADFYRDVLPISNMLSPITAPNTDEFIRDNNLTCGQYFLHVGRLVAEKRLDLLLQAWSEINPEMPLVVAGEFYEAQYRDYCKSLAPKNVKFLGPVFDRNLSQLYANSFAIAQPSNLEGASLVCLEAANFAKCIICSDISANKIQLGENAIFFERENLKSLCLAITKILENKSLADQIGKQCQSVVTEKYSPAQITDSYLKVYNNLLQK